MSVAPDHLADIRFAHLDFEDQLAALLYFCHQNLFRSLHKPRDDKLKKGLHGKLQSRRCGDFLTGFQDHACDGRAGLRTVLYPIVNALKIQLEIFTGHTRIIISNHFNKFPIARTAFVRYHHPIERTIFGTFSS